MKFVLLPLIALVTSLSGAETLRLPAEARLWLKVPAGQSPLRDIRVSSGIAAPAPWEKDPAVRERHTDIFVSGPLVVVERTDDSLHSRAGRHRGALAAQGPWAADENGAMPRQEILWDDITAEGAAIENGDFESMAEGLPTSWKSPWAAYPAPDEWPLAQAGKGSRRCLVQAPPHSGSRR